MENCFKGLCLLIIMLILGEGKLMENFYSSTCPNVESLVRQAVTTKISHTSVTIPATVRLFLHDCFVEGCDASVLIASPKADTEKDDHDNLSLAGDGFDTVIKAKQHVEAFCPGVVSCADILALATRDALVFAGGPKYNVELGRRDGLISKKTRVPGNLPDPNFNLSQLNKLFAKNNLSQTDMIALSGAHTLGVSHCNRFANRIHSNPVDPTMDPDYVQELRKLCHTNVEPDVVQFFDTTPTQFENSYFQNLVKRKGLLTSDQVLFTDPLSKPTVLDFAKKQDDFYRAFITAMKKLGRVGVKTGNQGEIRRDCASFNT